MSDDLERKVLQRAVDPAGTFLKVSAPPVG